MFLRQNRTVNRALMRLLALAALLCSGCGFIDLRPIGISTVPGSPWALLPAEDSPVIIRFDTGMEKSSVERALQVYSPGGIAEGELHWEGRNLFFIPAVPWKPGIRYGLRLSGTVSALDGRELLLSRDIPFFAVVSSSLPYVSAFSPADGTSAGIYGYAQCFDPDPAGDMKILEIVFSQPMDRRSTEEALQLDIPGERKCEWLDDDRVLSVRTDKPLSPWTVYKWSISDRAANREGAPLAKEISGRFITDLEREFIRVVRAVPLLPPEPLVQGSPPWGSWVPAGLSLETGPGPGHGIGVEFSKPFDSESLRRAFSFVPSLPGRVEILSPVTAVFIPSKDPESETVYSMRISGALKDSEGLAMGGDFTVLFRPDIPFLKILSISLMNDGGIDLPQPGSLFPAKVYTGGIIRYLIHFSLPFDPANQANREECAFRISLKPFFPGILSPVSLRSAQWLSSDRLLMEWEGAEAGAPGEEHFYVLSIPGASKGIHNGRGSYLKEDFYLYLEAES